MNPKAKITVSPRFTPDSIALLIARYGLVLCFLFIGLAKFTPEEATAIQPFVAHSPLMSWMYSILSLQGVSNLLGVTELATAALLIAGTWLPWASFIGGIASALTFLSTVSFLFSTPGAIVFVNGIPGLGSSGQFLIKDVVLLGASVAIAAAARARLAASRRSDGNPESSATWNSSIRGAANVVPALALLALAPLQSPTAYRTTTVDDFKSFCRGAGPVTAPTLEPGNGHCDSPAIDNFA